MEGVVMEGATGKRSVDEGEGGVEETVAATIVTGQWPPGCDRAGDARGGMCAGVGKGRAAGRPRSHQISLCCIRASAITSSTNYTCTYTPLTYYNIYNIVLWQLLLVYDGVR